MNFIHALFYYAGGKLTIVTESVEFGPDFWKTAEYSKNPTYLTDVGKFDLTLMFTTFTVY